MVKVVVMGVTGVRAELAHTGVAAKAVASSVIVMIMLLVQMHKHTVCICVVGGKITVALIMLSRIEPGLRVSAQR